MKVRRHRPEETGHGRQIGGIDASAGSSGHCCGIDSPLSPSPHPPDLTSHWSSAICHPPFAIRTFAIRRLPSAICHPPFAICHLPSAICHFSFPIPNGRGHPLSGTRETWMAAFALRGCCSGRSPRKLPKPSQVRSPRSSNTKEWKSCRAQHEASEGRQERDSHEHAWGLVGWCLGRWGCIARAGLDGGCAGAGVHR